MNVLPIIQLFFTHALAENIVLAGLLGFFTIYSEKLALRQACAIGFSVIVISMIAGPASWCLETILGSLADYNAIRIPLFVALCALTVHAFELAARRFAPSLHDNIEQASPTLIANTALLGTMVILQGTNPVTLVPYSFVEVCLASLFISLGYAGALILLTGIEKRLTLFVVPARFAGLPIFLISTGLVALALYSFHGIHFLGFTGK